MRKTTKKALVRGHLQQPQSAPVALLVPAPDVIRRLLTDLAENCIELLLFVIFQAFLGLYNDEAYDALEDPWNFIHGGTFTLLGRNGRVRCIRIPPAGWAWLSLLPDFSCLVQVDYRVMMNGKQMSRAAMTRVVNQRLRVAGFSPAGPMPPGILRRCKIVAMLACELPAKDIMQEVGLRSLHRYRGSSLTSDMGLDFFNNWPASEMPDVVYDWDLCRPWWQDDPNSEI